MRSVSAAAVLFAICLSLIFTPDVSGQKMRSPLGRQDASILSQESEIAPEAVFAVNSTVDAADMTPGDGVCATATAVCTLRAAIEEANALGGSHSIAFASPLFDSPQTISLTGGELLITSFLTITGPGADKLTIDGNNLSRIMSLSFAYVVLRDMTLARGSSGEGGAILVSDGTLEGWGLVIKDSVAGNGGGIYVEFNSDMYLFNSTLSGNQSSADGGGIFSRSGSVVYIERSTISGNYSANASGGGISAQGTLRIADSTIYENRALNSLAGGILYFGSSSWIRNTIIAGNSASSEPDFLNLGSSFTSQGHNLVGVDDAGNFTAVGDQKGTSATPLDPLLGPLANNGGTTPTHAPVTSPTLSPAIDQGLNYSGPTDQRGFFRPVDFPSFPNATGGNGADIGAYEVQAPTSAPISVSGRVLDRSGRGVSGATVIFTDELGETKSTVTKKSGKYKISGLRAGASYIVTVRARKHTFDPRFISTSGNLTELDLVAR